MPKLGDANGKHLKLLAAIRLRLRIGKAHFRVPFFVAPTLAAPLIIGTSFLDSKVKAIRCMKCLVQTSCGSIRILVRNKATMNAEEVQVEQSPSPEREDTEKSQETRTALRYCQTIHFPQMTQVLVMVRCNLRGLIHTEPKQSVFINHRLKLDNGVHEVDLNVPFTVLVPNFSNVRRTIQKHMVRCYATPKPTLLIPLLPDSPIVSHVHGSLDLVDRAQQPPTLDGKTTEKQDGMPMDVQQKLNATPSKYVEVPQVSS